MGKHKKSREYSSESTASSDSAELEKKKKHKKSSKKSKKSKKSRKRSSSSSDAWVEKKIDNDSPEPPASKPSNREDWMTPDNFFIPTFSKEKQQSKSAVEKAGHLPYDPATSSRELNPYFKTGEGGLPSFQRPKDSDEDYRNVKCSNKTNSSGNWRKTRQEERTQKKRSRSRSESFSPEHKQRKMFPARPDDNETDNKLETSKPEGISASYSDFLTDEQMNEIGAKMIKAELTGKTDLALKLKDKLERARAFKTSVKVSASSSKKESVVLSITNAAGDVRPASQREETSRRPQDKKKKNKRVETHENGERINYYPDDGKYDIKQMFEREKYVDGKDQDIEFAKAISKVKDCEQMDMADIFSDNIRKDSHKKTDERNDAIREHNRMEKILDSCNKCFDSPKMDKNLVIHVGKKIYLAIPYYEGLVNHHVVISTIQHVPCATMIDEDIWEEVSNLKKALEQLFNKRNEDAVFFETVRYLNRRPHMEIHCIASSELEMVQFYFKKAIQECEKGTLNKKLIELKSDKNIRRSVPRSLPYFWVDFGSSGFAHVIEDQETFPSNFAQEIIGGMLNLHVNKWRKPRKEQQPQKRISYFSSLLKDVVKSM